MRYYPTDYPRDLLLLKIRSYILSYKDYNVYRPTVGANKETTTTAAPTTTTTTANVSKSTQAKTGAAAVKNLMADLQEADLGHRAFDGLGKNKKPDFLSLEEPKEDKSKGGNIIHYRLFCKISL